MEGRMAKKDSSLLYTVSVLSRETMFMCQSRGFGVRALDSLSHLMCKRR